MFHSARLKLTIWYLLIIMIISGLFSLVIYTDINSTYNRLESMQILRQEQYLQKVTNLYQDFYKSQQLGTPEIPPQFDTQPIEDARSRLQFTLLIINLLILSLAGILGYFLAGRTLSPIQKMIEDQNRFISDASHELRTPLTALKTEIEVTLREKSLKLNDARQLIKSNLEEVNRLQYLSDNLIKLAKYQTLQNNDWEKIFLPVLVNEVVSKISVIAKKHKIEIVKNVTPLVIEGDKQKIEELFIILLDNAIKYSKESSEILINIKEIKDEAVISITDYGIGISEENIELIFSRFYRADNSRSKNNISGYGLGLAIARQIVEQHHGQINVISKIDQGSTFTIKLPIKKD